jgi:hypothetical protein
MSWMSDNYEKVVLGGGAVVALALAYFGWNLSSNVDNELVNPATGRGSNEIAVPGAERLPQVISSMGSKKDLQQAERDGRPLDLFTGIALFAKRDSSDPVDPFKDPPVHPPIDNRWFLDNRIAIGYEDSPQRDPDGDGFSNIEEFEGKTLPNDPKSHPPLIHKLTYVDQEVKEWLLMYTMDIGPGQNQFKFIHQDVRGKQFGMGMNQMVAPGGMLEFKDPGPGDGRFKLLKVEEREVKNERINIVEKKKFAIIEDQKANKKGDVFEIPRNMPNAVKKDHIRRDRKASLELRAIGFTGKPFLVEERTAFALPPGAPEKNYFLKEVTDDGVVVVVAGAGGQKEEVTIQKGQFPNVAP